MERKNIMRMLARGMLAAGLLMAPELAYGDEPGTIVYTGAESEFVLSGRDLFLREDSGLPGDVYTGGLSIVNESENTRDAFLRIQDVRANGPDDMLERIPIMVSSAAEPVFEGFLAEAERTGAIALGAVPSGETMGVECMIGIPTELTSEYADTAVSLDVAVVLPEQERDMPAPTGASLGKTGDMPAVVPFVVGACATFGAVIWCAWKRRIRMW